jgi:RNA polymerase sigma-70 factor (sigma-E family)
VDDQEFDAYVGASGPRLKRLAFLLTGDLDAAEDLLQTAYAKALPRWSRIRTYDQPDAYMRRVLVNGRTSLWRRTRGREVLTDRVPDRAGADPMSARDEAEDLRRALLALPAKQRAAVVLRFYCDLSEQETAAAMGVSVGTVKSHTSRGLARLRELVPAPDGVTGRQTAGQRTAGEESR